MSTTVEKPVRPTVDALRAFCVSVLAKAGVSAAHSAITADALVQADAWGVFTHGTKLLRGYVRRLNAGGFRSDVEPVVISEGPAWGLVDGHSALGQVTGAFAMRTAIRKAQSAGIGYVGVRNSNHFAAAGYYSWLAAREGLIGIAMCNDVPSVAAPGSRKAVTGTNPLAYAIPAGERDPMMLDIATSTVAGGKVYAARQLGKPIAADWIVGPDGLPTTNANLYPEQASLAPMAGHKGYGLSLLIETLSGILTGAAVTWQVGNWMWGDQTQPTRHGAAFLAIDVAAIAPREEFTSRIHALIDEIHSAPTADGVERILLPGEREWANYRRALISGIPLPPDVIAPLEEVARDAGLTLPW